MTNSLKYMGYPDATAAKNYYTAQVSPGVGVAIAQMATTVIMVQFFPWVGNWGDGTPVTGDGHARYARFITAKATTTSAQNGELFDKWPFEIIDQPDILMIKCLIEEIIKTLEP